MREKQFTVLSHCFFEILFTKFFSWPLSSLFHVKKEFKTLFEEYLATYTIISE